MNYSFSFCAIHTLRLIHPFSFKITLIQKLIFLSTVINDDLNIYPYMQLM